MSYILLIVLMLLLAVLISIILCSMIEWIARLTLASAECKDDGDTVER